MKVRKSETTIIQESQDHKSSAKSAGTSPRATNSSADTVEMSSANRTGERKLTTDQQRMAPNIDPENHTGLLSGADPRAAIEGARSKNRPSTSQHGTGSLPNGQTGKDRSQYNVPTSGAPAMLKDSIGQLGSRGEQLKSLTGNSSDKMNVFNSFEENKGGLSGMGKGLISDAPPSGKVEAEKTRQAAFNKAMGIADPAQGESPASSEPSAAASAWEWVKAQFTDEVKQEIAETVIDKAIDQAGTAGGRVLPVVATPLLGPGGVVKEALGKEGPKNYMDGWKGLLGGQPYTGSQSGPVKDPGPDVDGTRGGTGGLLGPQIDPFFDKNILQGVTGKGPGGGEVVNPSREDTGGGKGPFVDNSPQLGQENANYLIGQPLPGEQTGFNGLSGSGTPQGNGGAIDYLDKSGWTGPIRTEEPGDVQTGPTGDLSHLIQNNNDEDDDDRK